MSRGLLRDVVGLSTLPVQREGVCAVPLSFRDWCHDKVSAKGVSADAYRAYATYCRSVAYVNHGMGGVGRGGAGFFGSRGCCGFLGDVADGESVGGEDEFRRCAGLLGCSAVGSDGAGAVGAGGGCVLRGERLDGDGRRVEGESAAGVGSGDVSVGARVEACAGGSAGVSGADGGRVFPDGEFAGVSASEASAAAASVPVSEKTIANRAKRARAKERKVRKQAVQGRGAQGKKEEMVPEWRRGASSGNAGKRGFFSESTPDMRYALRMSRGERLIAENDLKAFQARRRLELEKDKDVNALKKLNEAQLLRRTEVNKVQIEKAYASLVASGNVPGIGGSIAGGGSVETVVSGSSNSYLTISPGSSVSMKEVHEMQKENLRLKKEREELVGKLKAAGIDVGITECGGSEKTSWTVDKYGDLLEKYRGDPALPDGLVMDVDCRMRPDPEGKVEERVAKYYEEMSNAMSEIVDY